MPEEGLRLCRGGTIAAFVLGINVDFNPRLAVADLFVGDNPAEIQAIAVDDVFAEYHVQLVERIDTSPVADELASRGSSSAPGTMAPQTSAFATFSS